MHNILFFKYDELVDKQKVVNELNERAKEDSDWSEPITGIRWINIQPLTSEEEARAYIEQHDIGDYDQLAVRFTEKAKGKPSAKLLKLREKLAETEKKYNEIDSLPYAKTVKAAYIGCKYCGSKLSARFLRSNDCPLCRRELRPETTLKKISALETQVYALRREINQEERNCKEKGTPYTAIRWLVKIEYHS